MMLSSLVWLACAQSTPIVDLTKEWAEKRPKGYEECGAVRLGADGRQFDFDWGTGVIWNRNRALGPLLSAGQFSDCEVHVEFMIPKDGNSGVYLQGRYEVQIRDSASIPEKELQHSDCGGIYQRWADDRGFEGVRPLRQAARPPGEWQSLDIKFRAPRWNPAKKKESNARFEWVRLNGVLVQKDVECRGATRAALWEYEGPRGPLMLQGDHGPVAFRNVWIRPHREWWEENTPVSRS